jgi:hypothetical protein
MLYSNVRKRNTTGRLNGMRKRLYAFVAALGATAFLLFGIPAAANAANTTSVVPSQQLSGYSFSQGVAKLNSNRNLITLPSLTTASPGVTPDTIADGVVLVQGPGGGHALGAGFVWNDSRSTCGTDQWVLEEGVASSLPSQMPIAPSGLFPIAIGSPSHSICVNGGQYFVEVHYSSLLDEFAVVAAPTEVNGQTVYLQDHPFGHGIDTFLVAGDGIDTTNGTAAATIPLGTFFPSTRCGLTEIGGQNILTIGGKRITCDAFTSTEFEGTLTGAPATVGNPITMHPTAIPTTSTAFTVLVP